MQYSAVLISAQLCIVQMQACSTVCSKLYSVAAESTLTSTLSDLNAGVQSCSVIGLQLVEGTSKAEHSGNSKPNYLRWSHG
jgi:hypothetical protein